MAKEKVTGELQPQNFERKIRVYAARTDDDFTLTLPPGCSLTFGYFNPGAPSESQRYGKAEEEKRTSLRVYGPSDGTKKDQLACFLGVKGFRDEAVKLAKIVKKVTVEQRYVDDGEGTVEGNFKRLAELTVKGEDDETF